ncbi:TolC family protein [Pedobacter cryoconitis]|uniref:Outer membrane protein TolC n=1 Tax=Pedobacter cryoconitis TaxID=188932 RepID=A0A7X0J7C5_9SPHI|nr:TolC family protein [Pedobacter cryoconitis]MBB6501637.1 outer membrane protein TolC [Pedobacter cryoconitis]
MPRISFSTLLFSSILCTAVTVDAQTLNMKEAVNTAITNYGTIKAKGNYVNASKQTVEQAKRDYLPNFTLAAQQDYGTINGQNGPLSALGGLSTASSGPALAQQNWNAAFGALYLSNVNWDFFSFGRIREKINVSKAALKRDVNDLNQEIFQHEIRVSAAYLNLLAAQRLTKSQQKNLERATIFKDNAVLRARNGLIAGVDSSLAGAEVSSAKIALTKAIDLEQEQANKLGVLLGVTATNFKLDTASINHVPQSILLNDTTVDFKEHPLLKFYKNRVEVSNQQLNYYKKLNYPTFSLIGIFQGRGSGFETNYPNNLNAYTHSYSDGVNPTRGNYLLGIGVTWNLTTILRNSPQIKAQRYISNGLENEYELVDQQLHAQLALSETKIKNAMDNYNEAPVQVKAASEAYLQKSTLYKNGLTTIVDLTQALYALNRAEIDRDIAYTNVWQALLLKSAAMGDYNLFINEF